MAYLQLFPSNRSSNSDRKLKRYNDSVIVKKAYCHLYAADLPTIDCSIYLADRDDAVDDDGGSWEPSAYFTSMCTFDQTFQEVNCTVLSGSPLLEQLEVSCYANSMVYGSKGACGCRGIGRGFMDRKVCASKDWCFSENHQDWTDDCQWCYVERQCETGQFMDIYQSGRYAAATIADRNFILPYYSYFDVHLQEAFQNMGDDEEYLMDGLEQYINAEQPPFETQSLLWNVQGLDCIENRLDKDGETMVQTSVGDEAFKRSSTVLVLKCFITAMLVGLGCNLIYQIRKAWHWRQQKIDSINEPSFEASSSRPIL